jgi:PKD repeat protein
MGVSSSSAMRASQRLLRAWAGGLALAVLGALAAPATAAAVVPAADFTWSPNAPRAGQEITLTSTSIDDGQLVSWEWDINGDETIDATGPTVEVELAAGDHPITLRVTDDEGLAATVGHTVTVAPEQPRPAPPRASFTVSPAAPHVGQTVTFRSTASADAGIQSQFWDLDGDGRFDDARGSSATFAYDDVNTYTVALRVVDRRGRSAVAFQDLVVTAAPGAGSAPAPAASPPTSQRRPSAPASRRLAPRMLVPFPKVRIKGAVFRRSVAIRRLTVLAPRGSRVRVKCRGRGCPRRGTARRASSGRRPLRLRRFERRLGFGAVIEVFVTSPRAIGKYTRFTVRRNAGPARRDLCLRPGARRPTRCPS